MHRAGNKVRARGWGNGLGSHVLDEHEQSKAAFIRGREEDVDAIETREAG